MIDKIRTDVQFEQLMKMIEIKLQKATESGGFNSLSKKEKKELQQLSLLAADYEDKHLKVMPLTLTLSGIITQKLQEYNLTQRKLAEILGIGTYKLSQILNGKRQADVSFLRAVHKELHIDPAFLLENA